MATMWDDVPAERRSMWQADHWKGCRAATVAWHGQFFCRCLAPPVKGGDLCYAHGTPVSYSDEHLMRRAILAARRAMKSPYTVAQVRALSEADMREMRNVGIKMVACLKRVRDTWTDEQIAQAFDIHPSAAPEPARVEAFFAERPSVFAVIGG